MDKWLQIFPVPEKSPAHHVRNLRFSFGGRGTPEEFFKRIRWFTNVKKIALNGGLRPGWTPPFFVLPPSATSLTIDIDGATLLEVRDVMAQLPNLNKLTLNGYLAMVDRAKLRGIGTTLKGKFGGRLRLFHEYANEDVVNMLLEVPTGLRFTELDIRSVFGCLLPVVKLAEACGGTLIKLFYSVDYHSASYRFLGF
jgi:hypothetical protein